MHDIQLEPELEQRLTNLAQKTGQSKNHYIRTAIITFLEDQEDYLLGIATLKKKNPRLTLEQVENALGLES
ncbi:type II toxin-antitoxin system RelB family antitoxin [Magnetococcales bacterium HHB-1]